MFLFRTQDLPKELLTSASLRELAKGEILCRQGEPVEAVFVVLSGRIQLCATTTGGKPVPLYTARAGECVSEAALFAETYCSDVIAETKSRVHAFPNRALRELVCRRSDLAAEFMGLQAERCMRLRIALELRSLRTARERILQYIETFADPRSKILTLDRTLRNVSDDLGLAHESFYRTLAELVNEGIVIRNKTTLRVRRRSPRGRALERTQRRS